jgi:hypothetical protein
VRKTSAFPSLSAWETADRPVNVTQERVCASSLFRDLLALPFMVLQGRDIVMHPETGQSLISLIIIIIIIIIVSWFVGSTPSGFFRVETWLFTQKQAKV